MRIASLTVAAALLAASGAQAQTAPAPTPAQGPAMTVIEGPAFLEQNSKAPGVVTLPSGLQYKMEKNGEGRTPGPRDVLTVNLTGTAAMDGTEFDRTPEGSPARRAMMALQKGDQPLGRRDIGAHRMR